MARHKICCSPPSVTSRKPTNDILPCSIPNTSTHAPHTLLASLLVPPSSFSAPPPPSPLQSPPPVTSSSYQFTSSSSSMPPPCPVSFALPLSRPAGCQSTWSKRSGDVYSRSWSPEGAPAPSGGASKASGSMASRSPLSGIASRASRIRSAASASPNPAVPCCHAPPVLNSCHPALLKCCHPPPARMLPNCCYRPLAQMFLTCCPPPCSNVPQMLPHAPCSNVPRMLPCPPPQPPGLKWPSCCHAHDLLRRCSIVAMPPSHRSKLQACYNIRPCCIPSGKLQEKHVEYVLSAASVFR